MNAGIEAPRNEVEAILAGGGNIGRHVGVITANGPSNANPVLQHSNNYGTNDATWLRPEGQSGVMNARLFKVSAQVNF